MVVSITSPSFVGLHLLVSEIANVLSDVVYCSFTRTTLFMNCLHVDVIRDIVFHHFTKFRCS